MCDNLYFRIQVYFCYLVHMCNAWALQVGADRVRALSHGPRNSGWIASVPLQPTLQAQDASLSLNSSLISFSSSVPSKPTIYHPITKALGRTSPLSAQGWPYQLDWLTTHGVNLHPYCLWGRHLLHCYRARVWYNTPPAQSVLQCIFLRHQPYFMRTLPQVYHAAASWLTSPSSSSHCSHSQHPHHMYTCLSDMMPSPYNIPMIAHARYIGAHPNTST